MDTMLWNAFKITGLMFVVYLTIWILYSVILALMTKFNMVRRGRVKTLQKWRTVAVICCLGIYAIVMVLNIAFLTTPLVRDEIATITEAEVTDTPLPPVVLTPPAHERRAEAQAEEATAANDKAMAEADKLFQ